MKNIAVAVVPLLFAAQSASAIICEQDLKKLDEQLFSARNQVISIDMAADKGWNHRVYVGLSGKCTLVAQFTDGNYCIVAEGACEFFPKPDPDPGS